MEMTLPPIEKIKNRNWFARKFEAARFDKRLQIFMSAAALTIVAAGFLIYYNSESQIIARLSRRNPRGQEFVQTIAQAKTVLARPNLRLQERVDAFMAMAVAKSALGDHKGAIEDYQEIIKINVAYPIAHKNLAALYQQLGQYEKAEYEYLAIIATQPQIDQAYLDLADLYQGYLSAKENLVPAVLIYALDRNGKKPIFYERLAQYYFDKKLYQQSLIYLEQLKAVEPESELANILGAEVKKHLFEQ